MSARVVRLVPLAVLLATMALLAASADRPGPARLPAVADEKPAPAKKLLSVEDLYRFDAPRSPALAPDGKSVAYARHFLDARARSERSSLWRGADKAEVMEAVSHGERTGYEVATALPWTRRHRSFSDLQLGQQRMALTETLAHLEELRSRGLIHRERRGDVLLYTRGDRSQ